jgi:hypothetical protein
LPWAITLIFATLLGVFAFNKSKVQPLHAKAKAQPKPAALPVNTPAAVVAPEPVAAASANTEPASKKPRFAGARSSAGKALRVGLAVGMLSSLGFASVALADAPPDPTCADATPDCQAIIPFDGQAGQNEEDYWEAYFGEGWTCNVVNEKPTPVVLTEDHDALVVKAGNWWYIWQPAPAGEYQGAQDTSHYYVCDNETVEEDIVDPHGYIFGPCGDPAYAGTFDNRDSTVALRFRFRWRTTLGLNSIVKMVPAGHTYNTVLRWAKPGTWVRVSYQDPNTGDWLLLASEQATKGRFPMCTEWQKGWDMPFPQPA